MPDTPPPSPDLWTLIDLETPWSVMVAVTLGVPEQTAGGPVGIEDLARQVRADPDFLLRVLRKLAGHGLFDVTEGPRVALTEAGRVLLGRNPGLDLDGIGGRMANVWSTLLQAVRTGRSAYADRFGKTFWEDLDANPAIAASFDEMMGPAGHGTPNPEIVPDGDWSGIRTVVDVGGGTGSLLAAILRAHPDLEGMLVDLPETIERARRFLAEQGVADRVSLSGQSFFDPLPRGGDLYVLHRVLNDWPDTDKHRLLARCAEAMGPDSRLMVLGGVAGDDEDADPELLMMVLVGAGDTPLRRFRELAAAAGLRVRRTDTSPSEHGIAVECVPA